MFFTSRSERNLEYLPQILAQTTDSASGGKYSPCLLPLLSGAIDQYYDTAITQEIAAFNPPSQHLLSTVQVGVELGPSYDPLLGFDQLQLAADLETLRRRCLRAAFFYKRT